MRGTAFRRATKSSLPRYEATLVAKAASLGSERAAKGRPPGGVYSQSLSCLFAVANLFPQARPVAQREFESGMS